jgi:hypothetical protein
LEPEPPLEPELPPEPLDTGVLGVLTTGAGVATTGAAGVVTVPVPVPVLVEPLPVGEPLLPLPEPVLGGAELRVGWRTATGCEIVAVVERRAAEWPTEL